MYCTGMSTITLLLRNAFAILFEAVMSAGKKAFDWMVFLIYRNYMSLISLSDDYL